MMRGYLSVVLLSCCAASAFEQSYDPTETLIVISKPRRRESVFATLPFANRSQGGGAKHLSAESSQGAWRCNDNGEWLGEGDGCRCWEGWEGAACEKSICGLHGTPLSLVCGLGALEACRARFPGRLVTELCVCGAGWEGSRCQLPAATMADGGAKATAASAWATTPRRTASPAVRASTESIAPSGGRIMRRLRRRARAPRLPLRR